MLIVIVHKKVLIKALFMDQASGLLIFKASIEGQQKQAYREGKMMQCEKTNAFNTFKPQSTNT